MYTNKIVPPEFMATTRLKVLLKDHKLPATEFEIIHPRTSQALHAVGDFTKSIIDFAKQL